jgi:hypothetical protein
METRVCRVSQIAVVTGLPAGLVNPIEPDATDLAIGSRRREEDVVHDPDDGIGPVRR